MKSVKKIVIIGLGLMGGSLAAAIRKKFPRIKIAGVARRRETLKFALRKKWIHRGFLSVDKAVKDAGLIVICTPVDNTAGFLKAIESAAVKPVIVTDVGSVKAPICSFTKKKKWKYVRFVGAHPMFGSHEKGIEHARNGLYGRGLTILTARPNQPGFKTVSAFWKSFSGKVLVMNPEQHDKQVAEISHLPHLLAVCLIQTVSPAALKIAASGFRDTTRVAEGVPSVWAPIFLQNKKAASQAVRAFKKQLNRFESILNLSDFNQLASFLKKSAHLRAVLAAK